MTATFFLGRWAIGAPALGGRDAGLAATLSFVVAFALYGAIGLALLEGLLLAIAAARRRFSARLLLGFAIASLPACFAAIVR